MVQKYFLHVNLPAEKNKAMNFNFKEIATAGMILFAVIDILGSIPIILSLRKKVGHVQSEKASIVATCIMIAFLFVWKYNYFIICHLYHLIIYIP